MEHIVFSFTSGPWWGYVILVALAAAIAVVAYQRTMPEISRATRVGLIVLRTLGVALLLIALFEPVLRLVRSTARVPQVAIVVDESRSVVHGSTLEQRRADVLDAIGKIRDVFADAEIVGFGGTARPLQDADSLRLDGERTNPAAALRMLSNRPTLERPALVVMIGDGNANTGDNPTSVAEASGIGVYTLGVGNTARVTDVAAQSVFTSGIVVVDRPTYVVGRFQAVGMQGTPIEITLEEEGAVVGRDTITPSSGNERLTSQIQWTPSVAGTRNVRVRAKPIGGEFSATNNSIQDLVDVRTNKRTIVVFAGAPSPDVSFITQTLQTDPTITVRSFIQKNAGTFYGAAPTPADLDGAEACVMIGFPIATTPENVLAMLQRRLSAGLSILFIPSKDLDYGKLSRFADVLPFRVAASRPTEFLVTPDVKPGLAADPVLKITGGESDAKVWETLPPIYRTETFVTAAPGTRTLATIRVNNIPMDEPLIMTREQGASRSMAILGYGLYRWKLLGEGPRAARGEQPQPLFASLLGNSISWLAVKEDQRRVRIRSTQRIYAAGESVAFEASILDQTYMPVDDAVVTVAITGSQGARTLTLAGTGGGRYVAAAGTLPPGSYTYSGTASADGAKVGTDNGRFIVGDLGLEDASLNINSGALSTLAERTGGRYAPLSALDSLLRAVQDDPRLAPRAVTTERDTTLWNTPWPIAAAILAFSLEWFTRKRCGLV